MKKNSGIDGGTKLIGIFGWPLTYTLSPVFQNAGLSKLGLNMAYMPFPVQESAFPALFRRLKELPAFLGGNVTNPHKLAALRLADRLSPQAKAIGAVNTLYRKGSLWIGHNTDAQGFVLALQGAGISLKKRRVLILGAGGSARAIAYGVLSAGAQSLVVASRRKEQASRLLRRFGRLGKIEAQELSDLSLGELMAGADLIVSTVPGAAFAQVAAKALAGLPKGPPKQVFDISYSLKKNPLLKAARRKGHGAADGAGMLLEQGCASFRLWTGKAAPKAAMQAALAKAY